MSRLIKKGLKLTHITTQVGTEVNELFDLTAMLTVPPKENEPRPD